MGGGIKSKRQGDLAERLFEGALNRYQAESMLQWYKNFPEFVPLRHLKNGQIQGFFKAKSGPDYSLLVRDVGPALIECKLFSALNKKSYGLSLHQYEVMHDAYELGFMAGYVVLWQNNQGEFWTYHPIQDIVYEIKGEFEETYKLVFKRVDGINLLDFDGGVPEIAPIFGFTSELIRGGR